MSTVDVHIFPMQTFSWASEMTINITFVESLLMLSLSLLNDSNSHPHPHPLFEHQRELININEYYTIKWCKGQPV